MMFNVLLGTVSLTDVRVTLQCL